MTDDPVKRVAKAMFANLKKQSEEGGMWMRNYDDNSLQSVCVDGDLNLEELADAAIDEFGNILAERAKGVAS